MNQENIYQYDVKDTVIYLKTLEHYFEQAPDAPLFDYVDIEDSFIYFGFDNKYLKLVDGFIYDEQNHVGDFFTDWENCWMDVIEYPLNYSMKYNTLSGFFSRSEYIFNVNGESGNYKHLIGHQTNDGVVFGEVEVLTTTTNVQTKGLNMQIYPNPIQGEFYVQLEDYQEIEPAKIILYNSFGQQIWQQYLSGEVETMIDISSHASGIYFVHLWITGKPVAHQKLIKL